MILADRDSEHYKKVTHDKWKRVSEDVTLEDSLYCEDILLEYVNGKKEQSAALGQINTYLEAKGLIKKNINKDKED